MTKNPIANNYVLCACINLYSPSYITCSLPGYYCDNCGITVHPDKVSSEMFIIICDVYNSMYTANFLHE